MSWAILLESAEAVRAAVADLAPDVAGLPLAGVGWATVEHERAERELDELLAPDGLAGPAGSAGSAGAAWAPLPRDPALGARAWLRREAGAGGADVPALVVLEPDTEGRVAASLARFGEGVAVIYLGDGPPGLGTLVRGGPAWGPHAILLGARAARDQAGPLGR